MREELVKKMRDSIMNGGLTNAHTDSTPSSGTHCGVICMSSRSERCNRFETHNISTIKYPGTWYKHTPSLTRYKVFIK